MSAPGRPKRELHPLGGSEAAEPRAWGDHTSALGRPKRELHPLGRSEAAEPRAWGDHTSASLNAGETTT